MFFSRLQTNHIGTSLVALLLLPYLSNASITTCFPRIVIVSSDVHYFLKSLKEAKFEKILDSLNNEKTADMGDRYFVSKCE